MKKAHWRQRPATHWAHHKRRTMFGSEYASKLSAERIRLCIRHKSLDCACKAAAMHTPCAAAWAKAIFRECERKG